MTHDSKQLRRLFRFQLVDVIIAMSLAGVINLSMLVMASSILAARAAVDSMARL